MPGNILKNLSTGKKILIGIFIFFLIIFILLAAGFLKFSFRINKVNEETSTEKSVATIKEDEDDKPTSRFPQTLSFGGNGYPLFEITLPKGWIQGSSDDPRVNLVIGPAAKEKTPQGSEFSTNINAIVNVHGVETSGIETYQAFYKESLLSDYQSMQFIDDYLTVVDDMDVYVLDVTQVRDDGLLLHQIQYIFYVDKNYALAVTGTSLESTWINRRDEIASATESIRKIDDGDLTKNPPEALESTPSSSTEVESELKEKEPQFLTYQDLESGISILYPSDWEVQKQGAGAGDVTFLSPKEGDLDPIRENVSMAMEDLSLSPLTLQEYTQKSKSGLSAIFSDMVIKEEGNILLAGNTGYRVLFTVREPTSGLDLKWMMVWMISDNKAYILSFIAGITTYDEFLPTFNTILNSFEVF